MANPPVATMGTQEEEETIEEGHQSIRAVVARGLAPHLGRKPLDRLLSDSRSAAGPVADDCVLLAIRIESTEEVGAGREHDCEQGGDEAVKWTGPGAKVFPEEVRGSIRDAIGGLRPGDLLLVAGGRGEHPCRVLGAARL